jgi:teichuronic acid biosynthesis glycosyltransferase TuaH
VTVDYVVYGSVAWDSPWLTEHNLADALARDHRVLFVEPPVTPLTPLRYGLKRETPRELWALAGRPLRRSGRVHVLRTIAVPPKEHARARRASRPLLRTQVARAVSRLGFDAPVVVAARSVRDMLGAAGERASVYLAKDLVEAGAALIGKDARQLAEEQLRMCHEVDVVCAVTRALQDTLGRRGVSAELLPHGFHADLAPAYDDAEMPPELAALSRPLLGYAGRIDGRLDFDALAAVADRFATGSLVLIGPVSPRLEPRALAALSARPNVHMLGSRRRGELPAYLAHLDCSLMPYREDEWLRHGAPLKMWDALYAGPAVAGSGCVALTEHPLVRYASPPLHLPNAVVDALAHSAGERPARRSAALENSWAARARQLDELVARRTGEAAGPMAA